MLVTIVPRSRLILLQRLSEVRARAASKACSSGHWTATGRRARSA